MTIPNVFAVEPGQVSDIESTNKENPVKISFFVPCYNEMYNIEGALRKLSAACKELDLTFEVLVFDDCSSDNTVSVTTKFMKENPEIPVSLYTNATNQGVARNFVEGAFRARGLYYRLVCGDDVEPIETHISILRRIGMADIIVPYFTEIGGRKLYRHIISKLYTKLVNIACGHQLRYYNGCPIYKRLDILRFHVETTGFGYQAEFLTRLLDEKRSYIEVPLVSIDREGSSSLNIRNFVSVGHSLLKISLRRLRTYLFK